MQLLIEYASKLLPAADVEILDLHHRAKVDAPSGTAYMLADAAAKGVNSRSQETSSGTQADSRNAPRLVTSRDEAKSPRRKGDIGMQALRGGGVPGEHTVYYLLDSERIEITHRAGDRAIFADGAVLAASWLLGKSPGYYSMRDVLSA